jgi:hypothetical protein
LEQNFFRHQTTTTRTSSVVITSSATIILKFQHWYDVLLIVRCSIHYFYICAQDPCKKRTFFTSTLKTSSRPKSNVSFK